MTVPVQPRPKGVAVMRQKWTELLFLHWQWSPEDIRKTLPPGLVVDTFGGQAWLGIVPFFMRDVRPSFLPPLPFLSHFQELNVRTYVRDSKGKPGVWFYSLDCNQPVAVRIARRFFHLPYFDARMGSQYTRSGRRYLSQRKGAPESSVFLYRGEGPLACAKLGSLEQFLIERYRLFAFASQGLFSGEVWHKPYTFSKAAVPEWDAGPLALAGFFTGNRPPDHAIYSPGVDVRVYSLHRAIKPACA